MGLCANHDPTPRSISPLLVAEEFYLAQYNATRRRSVDTGGLALALRSDGTSERPSGKGWGGWDDPQHMSIPYAEMLSRLYMQTMPQGVPEGETPSSHTTPTTRLRLIRNAGSWAFDPLSLSNDDLFETTCLIFDVLFTIDGASEDIGIQAHHLRPFLLAIRSVYSHDNTYHNYQHAVDVLQAMYVFLVDAGCIPPVSILESPRALVSPKWRRASAPLGTLKGILNNVDVFMLFIAAIGHDAGHPGLNNGFMKCAGTCLSTIFNHTSTLERMHCTLLLQLMRNHGLGHLIRSDNILFGAGDEKPISRNIRGPLVDTILATDMSLHFRWIKDFNDLIDERGPLDTAFSVNTEEGRQRVKILACQALMKCADISNPVRPHTISEAWSRALMNEWYAQATLERTLALPTSVPSNLQPPTRPSIFTPEDPNTSSYHHAHANDPSPLEEQIDGWDSTEITAAKEQVKVQVSFIDVFTAPLFAALARFAPESAHFYARCTQNRQLWEAKMGELTELEAELQQADVATPHTPVDSQPVTSSDSALPPPNPSYTRSRVSPAEHDTRSSIDSVPLFSPGMMSDFSFGRRTSATTSISSSLSSIPTSEENLLDLNLGNTPKAPREVGTSSSARDAVIPAPTYPSRHARSTSIVSSISAVSSYYTARSRVTTPDPDSPWLGARSDIPLFGNRDWRSPFGTSSPRSTRIPKSPFATHVGLFNSAASGGPEMPPGLEHEYRTPLGIEVMRAAYRASARKHAGTQYGAGLPPDEAGPAGNGFAEREYFYRRRSAGNVGPYIRPMSVR